AAEKAKTAIDAATDVEEVNKAKEDGEKEIENSPVTSEKEDVKVAVDKAKEDAKKAIDEAKVAKEEAIDKAEGLTETEKAKAKQAVQDAAEKAKTAIDAATDVEEVNKAKEDGEKEIENSPVTSEKEDVKVAVDKAKEDAKKAIDEAKVAKEEAIDKAEGLTETEKAKAKQAVQDAAEKAKTAIDAATDVEEVNKAKEDGEKEISVTLPINKFRVPDLSNSDQSVKDKLKEELLRLNPGATITFNGNKVIVNGVEIPLTDLIVYGKYEVDKDTPKYDKPNLVLGVADVSNNHKGDNNGLIHGEETKFGSGSLNKDSYSSKKLPKTGTTEQNTIFYGATVFGLGLMIAALRKRLEEETE
ncbi:DUF1542 domain-containing protein, partial [Granulicatella sp. zg-ZJ]|uniref:DUF1542 domain-containing protein n=1 Tax=Granulicatella sp. zg-ZJ TaxID=2678504 RepID=UPI0013D6910A